VADKLNMQQFKSLTVKDIHPSFTITKGRFYLKDPITFNVSGVKGQVIGSNGIDKTIDYTMSLDIPAGNVASQANTAIGNLIKDKNFNLGVGQTVKTDVKIGGTITNPTVNLSLKDVAGSVKNAIKDQFEQKKKELQDQANQQLQQAKQKAEEEKKKAEDQARQQAEQEKQKLQQQIDQQKKQQEENLKNQAKDKLKGIFGK
jgi:paraquat-inducible protein B